MMQKTLILINILALTFAVSSARAAIEETTTEAVHDGHTTEHHAGHHAHDPTAPMMKGGANLNLFPPPQANPSKIARPAKPELLAPTYRAQITDSKVSLKWAPVASADAYHLQVATDPNFKWLVVNQEILNGTSFDLNSLEKGHHYFWRVAALKTDNDPTYMKGWFALSTFETPQ